MTHEHHLADILANSITHGVGAALAIAGAVVLIVMAASRGSATLITSCAVYGSALILVYLCSTLYHSLARTGARHVFHVLDHAAIYVLIAGTYTPFTLISLRGATGWTLFAIIWTLAIAGIVFKSVTLGRISSGVLAVASAVVYIGMGWLVVFAMRPLIHAVGWHGVVWLAAGGVLYTAGIAFFALDHRRYFHALWHLFVLGGSVAHYFAVLLYVVR